MKSSDKEKYLGDQLHKTANIKVTIEDRVAKGYGIVSEISAILSEIPLGVYRVEMGLKLRQAMFLNGALFNSEAWHSVADKDIEALEKVDEALLRTILQSHPKVPLEFLFLETGAISVRYVVSSRRMNYLRTLIMRDDEELTKRILREQQVHPTPGDFSELVKDDFKMCKMLYNEEQIMSSSQEQYKKIIKTNLEKAAFSCMIEKQQGHSKVRDIKYDILKMQPYLKSNKFSNEDVSTLVALRTHTVRGIRSNFKKMYNNNTLCPLLCSPSSLQQDTQEHLLVCSKLTNRNEVATNVISHDDIYGDVQKQKGAADIFKQLIRKRNKLLEK